MKNLIFLIASVSLLGIGCKPSTTTTSSTGSAATAKTVNLAIWTNFVSPEILAKFEADTGIKVSVSNYSSNEELLAKLQAGAEGYDVAVPSDYMVAAMASLSLLEPIDLSKITNFKSLDPKVLKKYYDTENKVSVPFSWGTTGIAYNQKMVKTPLKGWKDLLANKELTGKFTLLDDVRETLGAALKMQALSLNTKANADLEKGKKVLLDAKKRLKGFTSETLAGLVNGEMAAAQAYSVDALMASEKTKGAVQYVIPEEGCTVWIDNLVIPKGAKNIEAAHMLINYLIDAKVGAERSKTLFSAPSNKDSLALLPAELKNNRSLFPDEKQLAKCEMLEDLGDDLAGWDRVWTEVKAGYEEE